MAIPPNVVGYLSWRLQRNVLLKPITLLRVYHVWIMFQVQSGHR